MMTQKSKIKLYFVTTKRNYETKTMFISLVFYYRLKILNRKNSGWVLYTVTGSSGFNYLLSDVERRACSN